MKKYYNRILLLITVNLLICLLVFICGCGSELDSAKKTIKHKYGVSIPRDAVLEYSFKTAASFHGDGVRYYVFKFENEPTQIISKMQSRNSKSSEQYDELKEDLLYYFKSALEMSDVDIAEDYLPDWDIQFEWNFGEKLGGMPALYYSDNATMVVCILTT